MSQEDFYLDREVFSQDAVVRTAHRYSDYYSVEIGSNERAWILRLCTLNGESAPQDLEARLRRDALDEQLRESVRRQTGPLQTALIQAALTGAQPISVEN